MYLAHAAEVRVYFTEEQIELFERALVWRHFISSGNVPLHLSRWPLQGKIRSHGSILRSFPPLCSACVLFTEAECALTKKSS